MYAITGYIDFKKDISNEKHIIEEMTRILAHRGPNGHGCYISRHALLGQRIPAAAEENAARPVQMTVGNRSYTIVCNGRLYNAKDLSEKLLAGGFGAGSGSDEEILLASYIAWGPDCAANLNGVFAFAIWDGETLFLCRDHMGIKPLYYAINNGALIFASEIKAILAHPEIEPVLDENGICEIMGLGPAHSLDNGVFANIRQLPAAHYLLFSKDGAHIREYWKLTAQEHAQNERDTAEHIRFLLIDAIKRQISAGGDVCAFLSGGLDSSIIAAVTANELAKEGRSLKTFSIDYEDNDQFYTTSDFTPAADDAWVDLMSGYIGSNHHRLILSNADLTAALSDAMYANDLPGMADIDSSLLLACREVRKHAAVALSGECADEVFGGYPWYVRDDLAHHGTFPWSGAVRERQSLLSRGLSHIKLYDYVQSKYEETISKVPLIPGAPPDDVKQRRLFYLNIKWFMNTLLTRKDRMTMANNLEARVPFADYRLVEYAFNIPRQMMFAGEREKGLLRIAVQGLLPNEILWRKKSPYPKTFHPDYTRAVQQRMNAILRDKTSPILQLIDIPTVQEIVDTEGRAFGRPWFGQLMKGPQLIAYLIQLNEWLKRFKVKLEI